MSMSGPIFPLVPLLPSGQPGKTSILKALDYLRAIPLEWWSANPHCATFWLSSLTLMLKISA